MRFAAAFALATVALLPSFRVTRFAREPLAGPVPDVVAAGEIVSFEASKDWENVRLGGVELTYIPRHNLYFGSVGFFDPDEIAVSGYFKRDPEARPAWQKAIAWLYSPPVRFFEWTVRVTKPEDEPTPLRLPSAVAKKVLHENEEQRREQGQKVREILDRKDGDASIACWMMPLANSVITSPFGSRRVLENGHRYFHSGIDMRAQIGTPLRTVGEGEVAFSEELIATGKMIMVYHGGGVFSRYMHLDHMVSKPGEKIVGGQLIGFTGNTGRSEAPHLHWEVVWKGKTINPVTFLSYSKRLCGGA